MVSVNECIKEVIDYKLKQGEKVGAINVHLYRPFSNKYLLKVLPKTVKKIAVLGDMFGLGEQSAMLHEKIGQDYHFKNINELWVVGDYTMLLADALEKRELPIVIRRFADKEELYRALKKQTESLCLILVKASRGMLLDELITKL